MTATPAMKPFRRGRYQDLPEEPRVPHRFYQTEGLDIVLEAGDFSGMRVHVRRYGEGPPLLLVHGLMTSSYSWRYAFEPLGRHFTCFAPDLPGNGRSDRPLEVAYTPSALAAWLGQVMKALDIHGCPVVANSMGGYLAMRLVLQDPAAATRLVNLHSPGVATLRMYLLRGGLALPGAKALLRWLIRRRPRRWAHRNVHYYDESLKSVEEAREYGDLLGERDGAQALVKYLSETMATRPMRALDRQLRALRDAGKPFPVPLLLVYARQDPMVPPRLGRVFAERIPSARLEWLSEASHFAHVDALERFLPPVLQFLEAGGP